MQNIQKHPMVTVKEAASALGIDERTVREKLSNEEWRGEKKLVGLKEKWFMHRGELDRQVERLKLSKPEERITLQGMDTVFDDSSAIDAEISEPLPEEAAPKVELGNFTNQVVETLWNQFSNKFLEQLEVKNQLIGELRAELSEKDRCLKLLPDLEKRAEEDRKAAELKAFEAEALHKQLAAIEEQKQIAEKKAQTTESLETELMALKKHVRALQRPWWRKMFGRRTLAG